MSIGLPIMAVFTNITVRIYSPSPLNREYREPTPSVTEWLAALPPSRLSIDQFVQGSSSQPLGVLLLLHVVRL